jgi:hypothetical protein
MDVSWVDRLLSDLERQAETERLLDRDVDVEQRTQDAYRAVGWVDRLRASRGTTVSASVVGYGPVTGTVDRVGRDWCVLRSVGADLVVLLDALLTVRGLDEAVVDAAADPVWSRLGMGAVLREAIDERGALRVFLRDGTHLQGIALRAGADFCEFTVDDGVVTQGPLIVPWRQMAAFTAR